jgi:hypothetical protein
MLDRMKAGLEILYTIFLKQAHLFVPYPKWFRSDDMNAEDVVLFFVEPEMKSALRSCQGGDILEYTKKGVLIQKTLIERSKRNVVRIAPEYELDFNTISHVQRLM